MQPKFDIGDTVLILDLTDEQKRNYGPSWVRGMNEYINQQAVILDKTEVRNQYQYKINLDSGLYWWDSVSFQKDLSNNQLLWL